MSIKIEGGGSKENVFSDSDSGVPLWNGKPLLNLVYPVGSIYWSSNNTNPGTLFGGTWTQIKDKFILAAGDSYTNGATGGATSVTLTVSNMPSHTHNFTPIGNVSSHSHTTSSHTHSFTPSGSVSSTFAGTAGTTGGTAPTFTGTEGTTSSNGAHTHTYMIASSRNRRSSGTGNEIWEYEEYVNTSSSGAHTHSFTPSGTVSSHTHSFTPSGSVSSTFAGTAGTTGRGGGSDTGGTAPTFTGTEGTTSSNGSGTSFSIMPPYIVKYCWERTA